MDLIKKGQLNIEGIFSCVFNFLGKGRRKGWPYKEGRLHRHGNLSEENIEVRGPAD